MGPTYSYASEANDSPISLAQQARRTALLAVIRARPDMPLALLNELLAASMYADDLRGLKIVDLVETETPFRVLPGEKAERAVIRVFRGLGPRWVSSGFFVRYLGLQRWMAQKICGELAARRVLDRRGRTSATRFRLAQDPYTPRAA